MSTETRQLHAHDSAVARAVAEFCSRERDIGEPQELKSHPAWNAVRKAGSQLWLDSGDLEGNRGAWTREFSGLTTNNTLLNKEVQKGIYDDLVPEAAKVLRRAAPSLSGRDLLLELAFILNAVHGRRLARAFHADVSVELHTDLVWNADASYEYGKRFHAICPEHFVVKIALTPEGLLAARRLEEDGVRVNCTLGFSARQNHLIARFARPHFVNVFLGRVNAFFEENGSPNPAGEGALPPGEAATLASQRMLGKLIQEDLAAPHTRQIAASMRDGAQVATLAGVDVLTMPVSVAKEFAASGIAPDDIQDRTGRTAAASTAGADEEPLHEAEAPVSLESRAGVFFHVGEAPMVAARQLLSRDPETLDGDRIRAVLADCVIGDMFPDLGAPDRERLAADGKIPDPEQWEDRVAQREASWDGLLTEAAIASFAADQAELDGRVYGLLE